jgi:formylglycine-generating enzyme required for sulfatase activity
MRPSQRSAISSDATSIVPNKKAQPKNGGFFNRPLPKWVWPALIGVGVMVVLLLPLLFYRQPGFTVVVRGAPPDSKVFVDDVRRGIPGIEKIGDNVSGLIRAQGLKSNVSHAVRVSCGGGDATLYLDTGSSVSEVSATDGEVINLTVKNCGPATVVEPKTLAEIDYNGPMRYVSRGAFLMGDNGGRPNERPARVVNLDYDYYLDKFEVTNQQYRAFCSQKGRPFPKEPDWDSSYSTKLDHPVVGVSWEDARSYCEEGVGKRLPTEAEWEKAASWDPKATEATVAWKRYWPWGNAFDPARSNFNTQHPRAVGQYPDGASAYGVMDLAGNVGEWVQDNYQPYPGNSAVDPNYGGQFRVLRGGTFRTDGPDGLRTTRRSSRAPTFSPGENPTAISYIGFRCAARTDDSGLQSYLKKIDR